NPNNSIVMDVLANDNFVNTSDIVLTIETKPDSGEVVINEDNTLQYTPGSEATDSFVYDVETGTEDEAVTQQGTVTVNVVDTGSIILDKIKAFPSASGHGVDKVSGGKGGKIFYVTNLDDNNGGSYNKTTGIHSGSFKYALNHPDAGYIIFRVSGVIYLNDELKISGADKGDKTVLGGTAPFPGIIVYGDTFRLSKTNGNFIIRGITFLGGNKMVEAVDDTFSSDFTERLILSDNTFGWGADEAYSITTSNYFTVQRNLAIEGEPDHNVGSIFSTNFNKQESQSGSAHDNAYIHIKHRFPNAQGLSNHYIDIVNQFAFNYGSRLESHKLPLNVNDVNNYYKKGPRSSSRVGKKWNADDLGSEFWKPLPKIFSSGNIISDSFTDPLADNKSLWTQHTTSKGFISGHTLPTNFFTNEMHLLGLDIHIKSALDTYNYNIVNKNVGSRYVMNSRGERIKYFHPFIESYLNDAIGGKDNAFLDKQSRFVLPKIPNSELPYKDSDLDGMADEWEVLHGLNVGERDHESVKDIWQIDGSTFINNAKFTNMQIFNDYVHGGFLTLISETIY
ncbi:MAG: Ig-like domain-containing protein, partial [Maribacter sp.]